MGSPTNQLEKAAAISKKIRFLLQNQSMTVKEFASQIGITREHLTEIVDGRTVPTRHLLQKICLFFAVKPEFFGSAVNEIMFDDPGAHAGAAGVDDAEAELLGTAPSNGAAAAAEEPKKRRKFDLAELAAHHQALLECLIEAKVFTSEKYAKKVEDVRKRARLD